MAKPGAQRPQDEQDGAHGGSAGSVGGPEREATDVEREGMDLLGRSGVRGDAIPGVSDPSARADQDVDTNRADLGGEGSR